MSLSYTLRVSYSPIACLFEPFSPLPLSSSTHRRKYMRMGNSWCTSTYGALILILTFSLQRGECDYQSVQFVRCYSYATNLYHFSTIPLWSQNIALLEQKGIFPMVGASVLINNSLVQFNRPIGKYISGRTQMICPIDSTDIPSCQSEQQQKFKLSYLIHSHVLIFLLSKCSLIPFCKKATCTHTGSRTACNAVKHIYPVKLEGCVEVSKTSCHTLTMTCHYGFFHV